MDASSSRRIEIAFVPLPRNGQFSPERPFQSSRACAVTTADLLTWQTLLQSEINLEADLNSNESQLTFMTISDLAYHGLCVDLKKAERGLDL